MTPTIVDQNIDSLIYHIEKGVSDIFWEKMDEKKSIKSDGCSFKSNNLIPREVRKLFKAKSRASKGLKTVTSVKRCTNIRDSILKLDIELKHHYEDRKQKIEEHLFSKASENKKTLCTDI